MNFSVPQNIHSIISILNNGGFTAHLVGGCVRDMLLGMTPKDWDITTNARPDEVKPLFEKTYDTGLKHGTLTVSYEGALVEITTWRTEAGYSDHRRPDRVIFAQSLTEDLKRRDFTMNAIAYHPEEGLVDPFGGLIDIQKKLIRCVGDPNARYAEDALRMLRAIRFAAQLDFVIDEASLKAIEALAADIAYVSMERIQAELSKILESKAPQKLALLWDTQLSSHVFPGISELPQKWLKACMSLAGLKDSRVLLLGLLFAESFCDDPSDKAKHALKRLKYDNNTIADVSRLIEAATGYGTESPRNLRKLVSEYGIRLGAMTLLLHSMIHEIKTWDYNLEDFMVRPAVTGLDLKKAGLGEGRDIGLLLSALNHCLYENPLLNSPEILMTIADMIQRKFN